MIDLDTKIKEAVHGWGKDNYEGASDVTKRLLDFWFKEEHILEDGSKFEFWRCQKEAIESLIYSYEICGYDSLYKLAQGFGTSLIFDPTKDLWPKYCFKMATGSGKTFVMALSMVWQYFNKIYGTNNERGYCRHFCLIAPNLIVLDRLSDAFADGKIFRVFPFIPEEYKADFDFQTILQSEDITAHSKGILHLTNVQQFYERESIEEDNPIDALLGKKPVKGEEFITRKPLVENVSKYGELLILNDEAHHVHSPELEWNKVIDILNEKLTDNVNNGLTMQLDFTATPMDLSGRPFPHIIYDYPLGEAIRDKIVKRPYIGEIEGAPEPIERDYVRKNQIQIDTGVDIFKKFKREFKKSGKKPVLFIMCDNVRNADKVGKYLEDELRYSEKVLVIHTDKEGNITKKDLPKLRKAAMDIDTNEYEIIVSVMMLKEGWDVKNVCVIVPLRAYTSQILVEQTLGRGLRRMMPDIDTLEERLVVVEHPRFRELWQAEIKEGELNIEISSIKKVYRPSNRIMVDQKKLKYDFDIPIVEGGITKVAPDISELDISKLKRNLFKYSDLKVPKIMYRERDLLTKKITEERELSFDYTDKYDVYLSYITKAVLSRVGTFSQFPELLPKVKAYVEKFLFDIEVNIKEPEVVKKLNHMQVRAKIKDIFVEALNALSKSEEEYRVTKYYKLCKTEPLHTSEPVYKAEKTVFDRLPYPKNSIYEKAFMVYLDNQKEVLAYTKVLPRFPLRIPYYDEEGFLRYYLPDFIVKTGDGFYLIETKGMGFDEMRSSKFKDKAAKSWCKKLSEIEKTNWEFVKILEDDFNKFKDLGLNEIISNICI